MPKNKVIINGAFGKMGVLARDLLEKHPDFEVIAGLGSQDSLGQKLQDLKPDFVLDLTRADIVVQSHN